MHEQKNPKVSPEEPSMFELADHLLGFPTLMSVGLQQLRAWWEQSKGETVHIQTQACKPGRCYTTNVQQLMDTVDILACLYQ